MNPSLAKLWISLMGALGPAAPAVPPTPPPVIAQPIFLAPPRLAITAAEFKAQQALPEFAAQKAAALRVADGLLTKPPELPEGPGSWVFYYACPDDGQFLRMLTPTQHQCPRCNKIYSDERTLAAYRGILHSDAEEACERLGWGYLYGGDERYAAGAKRILLKLAHDYPGYPERTDRWGHHGIMAPLGARRLVQSLDEATGIIRLAKGYDLTRNSPSWSQEERDLVEKDLFGLTQETLLAFNQDINNHQTWYDAGLLAIASVRGDANLVKKVLTMTGGVYDQLQRSVTSDGLWYEGTMAYHKYALMALMSSADTCRRLGVSFDKEPRFRALFEAPLHAAYPNGQFPAINDSDRADYHLLDDAFLWAWKNFKDPAYAQAYAEGNPARLTALLGEGAKSTWAPPLQSENMAGSGLAILRFGSGANAECTFMDYGPHGEGHGHFDKLNLMLYANGREWLPDIGRISYTNKEYLTWVKTTIAHNTVTLGGKSQQATTGKLLYLKQTPEYSACAAESQGAYPGSTLRRSMLLADGFLVDCFTVSSPEPIQTDWAVHTTAGTLNAMDDLGAGQEFSPGAAEGYQHLVDGHKFEVKGSTRWDILTDAAKPEATKLRFWVLGSPAEQLIQSTGIGYRADEKAPCLIRRTNAAESTFVTVYDLSGHGQGILSVTSNPDTVPTVTVTTPVGKATIRFEATDAKCQLEGNR